MLPVDTGGKIRSYNILRHLDRNNEVTLLSYYGGKRDVDYEAELRHEFPQAQIIWTATLDGNALAQAFDYLRRLFHAAPFAVSKFTHPLVQRALTSSLSAKRFDVTICDFLSASSNFPDVLNTPTVLFQHNLETALWRRMAATESNPAKRVAYRIEAAKMAGYEQRALAKFHHVIAVSENDRREMLRIAPSCSISVVPTGVDLQKYAAAPPSAANPPRLVFTGSMDWEPNLDAVTYFCKDIFPAVLGEFSSALFQIVGRNPHSRVKQLASEHVHVTGTVPSVAEYLRDATLVVVPLRIGGGTRLKIFEAMAMGKAVISTSIGAEGLDVRSGRDLVLADDAAGFGEAILTLLRDAELRHQYEHAAAKLAAQYDWSKIASHFSDVLVRVVEAASPDAQSSTLSLRRDEARRQPPQAGMPGQP